MEILRTPEEHFADLPGFPWPPAYREWEGLRLAHVDAGEGPAVVLLHGQPTWSFLYRKTIAGLVRAGLRAIAPDLPGFGRSDKPADEGWYSFDRHTAALAALFEELDLRDVTLLVHDWGGPIGFRLATLDAPERVARLVALDTVCMTGEDEPAEGWEWFRDLVAARPDFPVGRMVRMDAHVRPPREVIAGYDAPFPDERFKAGVRAFPRLVALDPGHPTAATAPAVVAELRRRAHPALLLWGATDPIFPPAQFATKLRSLLPGATEIRILPDTGHFLPEERGELLADAVVAWLSGR